LEIDSYVEKGKNLFKINPDAFAHIYLKDNLKKDYEGLKKNVEEMLKSVAKPVVRCELS
jgi:alpha-L-arabinofuranosidase